MNIRFEYLYCDAANYKQWGDVAFANTHGHDPDWLEHQARRLLIDSEFFIAEKAKVPDLRFEDHIKSLDHDWHCFGRFSETDEIPNDKCKRDIVEFLEALRRASTI